ncbi:hypothetical protein EUGRSUZ_H03117 [Eucalyptus grandis]|uniref:Uncharacterized protein n=2 Tax=Eucalyptus grandis TaxID=71139 RepID=A0ACC3JUU2_EUCGR|nr:hypothetical protein EUGRSUZ_H03117 [Eucalyptus grandis]
MVLSMHCVCSLQIIAVENLTPASFLEIVPPSCPHPLFSCCIFDCACNSSLVCSLLDILCRVLFRGDIVTEPHS